MLWHDVATIGTLILLEGLLSADNALVLAVLVRHLPTHQRKKALHYGIWGALIFRGLCIVVATWLVKAWFFKVFGALYLFAIALNHLLRGDGAHAHEAKVASHATFWRTVCMVELTDLAFSVDSILAAVAMSDKMWVIYLGGIAGIIAMRFVAGTFLGLLDRFPGLATGAYVLVLWIGIKLLLGGWEQAAVVFGPGWGWDDAAIAQHTWHMESALFWFGMAAIIFVSMIAHVPRHRNKLKDGRTSTFID